MALIIGSGNITIMKMTTPPTGWTKNVTDNDYMLRVVTGSVVNNLGGTAFSTVFSNYAGTATSVSAVTIGATTIDNSTFTAHRHNVSFIASSVTRTQAASGSTLAASANPGVVSNNNPGGGGSHTHPDSTPLSSPTISGGGIDLRVRYVDIISVTRN